MLNAPAIKAIVVEPGSNNCRKASATVESAAMPAATMLLMAFNAVSLAVINMSDKPSPKLPEVMPAMATST